MRTYLTLLALLLAGSWCAYSQHILSGTIRTPQNAPLEGAHIHIEQTTTSSAPDGSYHIQGISTGSHRLIISFLGYHTLDTIIDIHRDMVLDIALQPEAQQLKEVVVNETVVSRNTVAVQRVRTETIERYSNASLGDALQEVAGVSALKTGGAIVKPVINGLHSSRVPIISNNVRLEDQQWGAEHAPNLDINSAGRISVIKGAGALQYGGDAVGGLVLVEPLNVLQDTLFGKSILTVDTNGRGSTFATNIYQGAQKGLAWNASGTIKYYGDREAPDYILSNTGNGERNFEGSLKYIGNSYNISASYTYYNATIGIAKAMHIGTVSDLVRSINNHEPNVVLPFTYDIGRPRQEIQHHLAKFNYNKDLTPTSTLALQYAFQLNQRKEFDTRTGDDAYKAALDLTLYTHSLNADWAGEFGAAKLKAGVSGAAQFNDANPATGIRPLIPTYDRYDAGAYSIFSYLFSPTLSTEAGIRYDFSHIEATKFYQKTRWASLGYQGLFDEFIKQDFESQWLTKPQFTYHNFSASIGLRKKFNDQLDVLVNTSIAMRNPNPSELFSDGLHHSNATIELGDLRMDKEKALKLSASVIKTGSTFSFEATPYLNIINGFIYLQPTGAEYTIRSSFPVFEYRQTNAALAGFDLHTDWKVTNNFSHHMNLAYVYGTNTKDDEPLIDMPPLNITNTIRYTKNEWHQLFVEFRSEAVFRQSRYPNYNFEAPIPINGELVPVLVDISTPPPGYHLLHFSSGAQFRMGKTVASINFSIHNLLNTNYRDYLNRQRFYVDEAGRNFQLQLKLNY